MNVITVESAAFKAIFDSLDQLKEAFKTEVAKREIPLSEKWLDNEQAMELLKVSKRTLQSYRDKGVLAFSQFGSKIYYKAADIEAHIERNYVPSTR